MHFSINRRRFIQTTSTALTALAMPYVATRASAQTSELRVVVYGGDIGKAGIEAFTEPFEAETGIKVRAITQDFEPAQLELMVASENVTVDVAPLNPGAALPAAAKGLLEDIDYSVYKKDELAGIVDFAKQPFGVGLLVYGTVMVWNTKKFPAEKPRPNTWSEFWDVEKFPGARLLINGQWGSEGPWEEALMADGVPADTTQIYPMDIGHVFAKLDEIKPHIRKWWASGSESQQLMRSGIGDVMNAYDGRAQLLIDNGEPFEINRNQAKITWDYWVIPKGSPNTANAQKFIEFATRADRQAAYAQLTNYGPTNRNAFKTIPDKLARKLASYPDYLKSSVPNDGKWYAEVGSDGKSNTAHLVDRWADWVLR
ncbi:ABC transporter substrate-binding protein [Rhizobium azibense]|uniref:Putative spermidine/putrescine transport system substrate-binding protein n=1 Tax=Rhizobium azibense TaxID=1136135 RepID=A0A4R3RIY1_9HYPH|nr:ABC transporter substrate-binding protein [Rhizobium azibense]TCU31316.1 putative spermidine/putrescine transport system substrate-binding protein [Rhizobium azibense]